MRIRECMGDVVFAKLSTRGYCKSLNSGNLCYGPPDPADPRCRLNRRMSCYIRENITTREALTPEAQLLILTNPSIFETLVIRKCRNFVIKIWDNPRCDVDAVRRWDTLPTKGTTPRKLITTLFLTDWWFEGSERRSMKWFISCLEVLDAAVKY